MADINELTRELADSIARAVEARTNLNFWLRTTENKIQEVYRAYDAEVRRTERELRAALSTLVMTATDKNVREMLHARRSA